MDDQTRQSIRDAFHQGHLTVQAVDADGRAGWFPIKDVMRHHVPHKQAIKVTLEGGSSVTVTEDHSLFVGLTPTTAADLYPGVQVTTVQEGVVGSDVVVSLTPASHTGEMYDLCVPGPESFVLANGILAHNSYSIGGVSLDLDKSSKYEGAYQAAVDQFDKNLEKAKQTVNIIKGLQQPKYGTGIRSSFGPYSGKGVLSPRKFVSA